MWAASPFLQTFLFESPRAHALTVARQHPLLLSFLLYRHIHRAHGNRTFLHRQVFGTHFVRGHARVWVLSMDFTAQLARDMVGTRGAGRAGTIKVREGGSEVGSQAP